MQGTSEWFNTDSSNIWCEPGFLCTWSGVVRLGQILCNIAIIVCLVVETDRPPGSVGYVWFTAICGLSVSVLMLGLYMLHIPENFNRMGWILVQLLYTSFCAVSLLVAGCICVASTIRFRRFRDQLGLAVYAIAAAFCFLGMILYIADWLLFWQKWRIRRSNNGNQNMINVGLGESTNYAAHSMLS